MDNPEVHPARGITQDGNPWIGAENPEIEIYMFSDYQCFQCRKMHFFMRNLINKQHTRLRLIHMNFPMDKNLNPIVREDFHNGAGALAAIAEYAVAQNKFWEVNDLLFHVVFKDGVLDLKDLAKAVGVEAKTLAMAVNNRKYLSSVLKDITKGLKHSISGTPTFVINGQVYSSTLPVDVVNRLLDK